MADLLWPLLLIVLSVGLVFYLKDKRIKKAQKWLALYLATSPLTLFISFVFYPSTMWEWWILELIIFYSFLFGLISGYLLQNKPMKLVVLGVYSVFILSFINKTIFFYRNDFNDLGGTQKMKGKIEAIDYIYKDAKGKKFGLLVFTPPVYTYAYDYLVWWHGGKKYNYIPQKDKKGVFYLLMEPDPGKPSSYKGWLETVIKTGTILETKELPSGFIIQKRYVEEKDNI